MVFKSPNYVPQLPFDPPNTLTIEQFVLNSGFGQCPLALARNPFTCGITGRTYTAAQYKERTRRLAQALSAELGWSPNSGSEWDKVAAIFSPNSIDYIAVAHAVHRLGGVVSPANAASVKSELVVQLKESNAKVLFTCKPLLKIAVGAANDVGIPLKRIFLLDTSTSFPDNGLTFFKTVDKLVDLGSKYSHLDQLQWTPGQGERQIAYLCFSSGTSGKPKAVLISHHNIISNILQVCTLEKQDREGKNLVALGILPLSHSYGLVCVAYTGMYRGDETIIMSGAHLRLVLHAIETFRINSLYLIPSIITQITKDPTTTEKFNLDCVKDVYTGAEALGMKTFQALELLKPTWRIKQCYGQTEASPAISVTVNADIWLGSSGFLLPGLEARLIRDNGSEVTVYDEPGELLIKSPSVSLGYLNQPDADKETFILDKSGSRWLKTGDQAMVRRSSHGNEHIFITDRIKELIKVKGFQVAPVELEEHIMAHNFVSEVAVSSVPDEYAGALVKAFIVRSPAAVEHIPQEVAEAIVSHVRMHKAKHKWLTGGVEFVNELPRTSSGKVLRRALRQSKAPELDVIRSRL